MPSRGYGILMLDASRKRIRFSAGERQRLLWNTHLVWITNWLFANDFLKERELWGITYYLFDLPDPVLYGVAALAAVSTLAVGRDFFVNWRVGRKLPANGLLAYIAAAYVWLLLGAFRPGASPGHPHVPLPAIHGRGLALPAQRGERTAS